MFNIVCHFASVDLLPNSDGNPNDDILPGRTDICGTLFAFGHGGDNIGDGVGPAGIGGPHFDEMNEPMAILLNMFIILLSKKMSQQTCKDIDDFFTKTHVYVGQKFPLSYTTSEVHQLKRWRSFKNQILLLFLDSASDLPFKWVGPWRELGVLTVAY